MRNRSGAVEYAACKAVTTALVKLSANVGVLTTMVFTFA
jgi:hypothetical protein